MELIAEPFRVDVGGSPVVGVLHLPAKAPSPCVIACHGMGASKDSDKYLLLGRELAAAGLAVVRFDFRGSGESGGSYEEATIATRIADVEAVVEAVARHSALDGRIGLLGSSLGGFVALWVASRRRGLPVVTWNAPADLRDLEVAGAADPVGVGGALVAETRQGRLAEAPAGLRGVLVIQGGDDAVVPPLHGQRLYARAAEPRALRLIAGADHRLSDPIHRREAVERSREWLARLLVAEPL
ncbi:MAG: alpha/beta fold hydrolase [Candidatus Rokubacteria bacterium]|nr:alpha/beta fold hydrolase [Candidatus Rokubacteria bacterium]